MEVNHKKGVDMSTCKEALAKKSYPTTDLHKKFSYEEGFKSGWYDRYLGLSLTVSRTSTDSFYATGYIDGQIAYDCNTTPLKQERGITCLKSLLV